MKISKRQKRFRPDPNVFVLNINSISLHGKKSDVYLRWKNEVVHHWQEDGGVRKTYHPALTIVFKDDLTYEQYNDFASLIVDEMQRKHRETLQDTKNQAIEDPRPSNVVGEELGVAGGTVRRWRREATKTDSN